MLASLVAILILSMISFALYAYDKLCAKRVSWRVPEFALLIASAFGGAMGAIAAMYFFHHKTLKPQFVYGVPFMIITQIIILIISANIFL